MINKSVCYFKTVCLNFGNAAWLTSGCDSKTTKQIHIQLPVHFKEDELQGFFLIWWRSKLFSLEPEFIWMKKITTDGFGQMQLKHWFLFVLCQDVMSKNAIPVKLWLGPWILTILCLHVITGTKDIDPMITDFLIVIFENWCS